jgi:hypothetical protein
VGTGHGANSVGVTVLRADHGGQTMSDFDAVFSQPYGGGVNVGGGRLDSEAGDDIAVTQADSQDGRVEIALYHRFDTDPLSGRIAWSLFDGFDVFDPDTTVESFVVGADGATVAVGELLTPAGEISADRRDEIVVGPVGGVPVVRVFGKPAPVIVDPPLQEPVADPPLFELAAEWVAYPPDVNSGTSVAVGDVNADGDNEIVTGPYLGHARIKIFHADGSPFIDPDTQQPTDFFALGPSFRGGVRVAVADVDLDGKGEVLVAPVGTGQLLAFETNGTPVAGWRNPRPYGPITRTGIAIAVTENFLRHR